MTLVAAVRSGFRNYFTFSGRAARSEYWYWTLFCLIVDLIVIAIFGNNSGPSLIANLVLIVPSYAVLFRRLHDIDRRGWWNLIGLTIIGTIPIFVWCCRAGTAGPNRFGADPLGARNDRIV